MDESVNFAASPPTETGMKVSHLGGLGAFDMIGGGVGLRVNTDSQDGQLIWKEKNI